MIRYLEREEYGKCRPLWQEAFPDESKAFTDYYFREKICSSRIIVKEDGGGRILTMAHLNPYEVTVRGHLWRLSYIVGVATASDSRRQGHMRHILTKMLQDMRREGSPFCYLMPASAAYYRPFGFAYVFDAPQWSCEEAALQGFEKRELRLDAEPERLAAWMNEWLKQRYEVYAVRDGEYVSLLQRELDTEKGESFGWFDGEGRLQALQAFWGLEKREQRLLYCGEEYRKAEACTGAAAEVSGPETEEPAHGPEGPSPDSAGIMARITNLEAMVQHITVNEDCPCAVMEVSLRVRDSLIPENDGLWKWRLDGERSIVARIENPFGAEAGLCREEAGLCPEDAELCPERTAQPGPAADLLFSTETLSLTIEQLTMWLFGYRQLDTIMEETPPFWCAYVRCLRGVFLDEIV